MEQIKDIVKFMLAKKVYWLAPVIIVLLFVGLLLFVAGGSAVAPFIYTLF